MGTSYLIGIARPIPNPESLNTLNRTDVIKFDRGATYQNSKACAYISDAALFASTGLPLLQLISKNSRKDFGTVAAISAETFTLNLAITNLFKETVRRKRPLLYNPDIPVEKKYKKDNFKSFFSGHTSTVACMSYSFAEMYAAYNPKSKLKPMVWSLSAVFPLVTGILRYKAGKHYWTDVITGYIAGAICGLAVPYLHRNSLGFNR
ncbi:MAG TPA: phosphatase PAP2 family protein [Chitinophagales bacterium]|nr:phosphatase PAP2 family protein [Chitinophagales bacterium]